MSTKKPTTFTSDRSETLVRENARGLKVRTGLRGGPKRKKKATKRKTKRKSKY